MIVRVSFKAGTELLCAGWGKQTAQPAHQHLKKRHHSTWLSHWTCEASGPSQHSWYKHAPNPNHYSADRKNGQRKGATSKNIKNCQKVSKIFSTPFDIFRAGQTKGKHRQKVSRSFSTFFDNFRAAPVLRPLLGGSEYYGHGKSAWFTTLREMQVCDAMYFCNPRCESGDFKAVDGTKTSDLCSGDVHRRQSRLRCDACSLRFVLLRQESCRGNPLRCRPRCRHHSWTC